MKKLFFKLFILLFLMISLPMLGLIEIQKHNQMQSMQPMPYPSMMQAYPMPPQDAPSIAVPVIVIFTIAAILSFLFIHYLSKNYIIPLMEIKNKIKEVKKENFDITFYAKNSSPSIKNLFATLNEMVIALKEKQKLQESFIQGLTHDLRSPALVQDRAISILESEFSDNELIKMLKNNNESYLNLINLIIESYSNLEVKINKTNFNLKNSINNILKSLATTIQEKQIKINTDFADNFMIFADYTALNRILLNLISNAADNIDNGKTITIRANNHDNHSIIIIEDNGNGISKDFLPFIFEKKASLHSTGQKAVSGLGLNLCKVLTEKNGGTIIAESEINKYTRFVITLPLKESYVKA